MSSFDLYRKKMEASSNCDMNYESSFIVDSTSATQIHVLRLNEDKQAALIINEKEGPDTVLVYTRKEFRDYKNLLKQDYFTWRDKTYFVYEDIDIVRDVNFHKQRAYNCNVNFTVDNNTYYGYYVASLAKYVDTKLENKLNITDNDKPILILPCFDWIEVGLKIVIQNKPYKIIDYDAITNNGICYCSLDRDFISKQDDVEQDIEEGVIIAGNSFTVTTNNGYFSASSEVIIEDRTLTSVTFVVEYGVDEITITTKNTDNELITTTYKVVS